VLFFFLYSGGTKSWPEHFIGHLKHCDIEINLPFGSELVELQNTCRHKPPDLFNIRCRARRVVLAELEFYLTELWPQITKLLIYKPLSAKLRFWQTYKQWDSDVLRELMLAEYWQNKIIDARILGNLPAWEGIRVVRERSL
jgi:hypothetical protein